MYWSDKDKALFGLLNNYGEKGLDQQINKSSEEFLKLKKRPDLFVIFGFYDLKRNEFNWQNNMNNVTNKFIKNHYMSTFGSNETLKKLFMPVVQLNHKYKNVIPYLMEVGNTERSVICFKSKGFDVYALTKIDIVKDRFNFQEFQDAMFLYRKYDELSSKTDVIQRKEKISVVLECKENLG